MFVLYSSYSCGISYEEEARAKTIEELQPKMDELDKLSLRWYVERDGELTPAVSAIHMGIFKFIDKLNDLNMKE